MDILEPVQPCAHTYTVMEYTKKRNLTHTGMMNVSILLVHVVNNSCSCSSYNP